MPTMSLKRTFGSVLKERRRHLGMTQAQVASKVGCRPNYIGYLESGQRRPSQKLVLRLAKALGLDAGELFLLANPAVRCVMAAAETPKDAEQEFFKNRALHARYGITRGELSALSSIANLGTIRSVRDFLHILQAIRQALTAE